MSIAVANRYARALTETLEPGADLRAVLEGLEAFKAIFAESTELREALESPAFTQEQKQRLLAAVLERAQITGVVRDFLRVVQAHYRMTLLSEIVASFRHMAYERMGVIEVKLTSAWPLTAVQQQQVNARFVQMTGRQIELEFRQDPSLIGGLIAQMGSTVYDGSIKGQLQRIRQQLAQVRPH